MSDLKILKATEELVAAARLEIIARENKSIGSILDTRVIQPLEEIKFHSKRSIKQDIEKRLNARRGGKIEQDIVPKISSAFERHHESDRAPIHSHSNFEFEEKIWRDKTKNISYSQRRKFQHPLLHSFLSTMDEKQKMKYKEEVVRALKEVAEKFRNECKLAKSEFDIAGIFHPEANAHRAHCQYLVKLNRGISCETIEDPVLIRMYVEYLKEERVRGVELSAEQKKYLELLDQGEKKRTQEERLFRLLTKSPKISRLKPLQSKKELQRTKSHKFELDQERENPPAEEFVSSHSRNALQGSSPAKIFSKKLKHEKIGYMKMDSVLGEEANRLQRGEEIIFRKGRDKSDLLHDNLSSWMLREIQDTEVSKTAIGKSSSIQLSNSVAPLSQPKIDASAMIVNFDEITSPGDFSAKKILPFEEFFSLLQSFGGSGAPDISSQSGQNAQLSDEMESNPFADPQPMEQESPVLSPVRTAPENLVQHLQKTDSQFSAYLKISEGEQLSSKLLSKLSTNLTKPRNPRKIIPLGKEAMALTDSRGRASKIATKGFPNLFNHSPRKSADNATDEDVQEGNILTRLQSQGIKADQSHASTTNLFDTMSPSELSSRPIRSKSSMRLRSGLTKESSKEYLDLYGQRNDDIPRVHDEDDCDLQAKLLAVWENLQLSTQDRLDFMAKYSSSVLAPEMSAAIDMWAETAVYFTFFLEFRSQCQKLKNGVLLLPIKFPDILFTLLKKVHPLLASPSPSLMPPQHHSMRPSPSQQKYPLSAVAVANIRRLIASNFEENDEILEPIGAKEFLKSMTQSLSQIIQEKIRRIQSELDDTIVYKDKAIRDWILSSV